MKGLVKNLAISCLIASAASAAQAQSSSIVEYPRNSQHVAPVIFQNNDDISSVEGQTNLSSEYRTTHKTPYVVEFGANRQPVSLQPPTIRPSGLSPRIQEFGAMPVEAFEPAPQSASPFATMKREKAARHMFNANQTLPSGHKALHTSMHKASTQLVPVQKLAIFPLNGTRSTSTSSRYIAAPESSNFMAGKNRPSL